MYCSICGRYIVDDEHVFSVFNRYEDCDDDAIADCCCVYCFNNLEDENE